MTPPLYPYYETELHFIRKLAQEFARKYPAAAARLKLEPDHSTDPHVERLIEAFALLCARIQNKLHDEFPELTNALLSVLYPQALAPIPSLATVQFSIEPSRGIPEGVKVPVGGMLHTSRAGAVPCRYRTCYPVVLWPLAISEAKMHPPPYPPGLNPPARAESALRIRFRCVGELTFDKMQLSRLRLHLLGENATIAPLYDLIFNQALAVAFTAPGQTTPLGYLEPSQALLPVGFELDEGLFPYPPNVFPGYRLLAEYFSYPAKFMYVDVAGWETLRPVPQLKEIELVIFLNKNHTRLQQILDANMFRLGCAPAVNLFEQTAEPIQLNHTRAEHRIVPDVAQPQGFEVYQIQSVTASSAQSGDREFQPFYHFRHGQDRSSAHTFWYITRKPSLVPDDRGTEVSLHLVDAKFDPTEATGETVVVRTLCTNRDLPIKLPRIGDEVSISMAFAAPGTKVKCVRNPSGSLRPIAPAGRYWHLISHLNLNHLSLTNDEMGTDAFKGILRLYDPTDPEGEPQASALAKQAIEGVLRISSERTTAWVGTAEFAGFVRGLNVQLELDETRFVGSSGFLFASVIERFLGLYVSVNSFTQLTARFRQHEADLKRWPPRSGAQPLG